jgi:hypothetical protein
LGIEVAVFYYALAGVAAITLREPAIVRRAYGRTRLVDRIGLVLDDPKGFESAWRSFVPEAP